MALEYAYRRDAIAQRFAAHFQQNGNDYPGLQDS